MTYADQAALAVDTAFKARVKVAIVNSAVKSALVPFDPSVESDIQYRRRVNRAIDIVFHRLDDYLSAACWALVRDLNVVAAASNPDAASGDLLIQAAADRLFNFMASVE